MAVYIKIQICEKCGRRFRVVEEDTVQNEHEDICEECWRSLGRQDLNSHFGLNWKQAAAIVFCLLFWYFLWKWVS